MQPYDELNKQRWRIQVPAGVAAHAQQGTMEIAGSIAWPWRLFHPMPLDTAWLKSLLPHV